MLQSRYTSYKAVIVIQDNTTYLNRPAKSKYYNPETDLYSLKLDAAFKYAFGTEQNKRFTISFLNDVYGDMLQSKIVDVEFENKEIGNDDPLYGKKGYIDILCTSQTGDKYIVEMQNSYERLFELRALYYLANTYSGQFKGENGIVINHKDALPVHILTISNNTMFPDDDEYIGIGVLHDPSINRTFTRHITFGVIELTKFNKTLEECKTRMDYWIYMIKNAENLTNNDVDIISASAINTEIGELIMSMQRSTISPMKRAMLDNAAFVKFSIEEGEKEMREKMIKDAISQGLEQGLEKGLAQGLEQGLEQGKAVERNNILNAMREFGLSQNAIEKIMQAAKDK